jgi:alginate O-acetyltransferase complex protein AlgI
MLLGGLWHGASWTFVVWGALHGLYLVAERILRHAFRKKAIFHRPEIRFFLGIITFLLVCIAWVFFRAIDFEQAFLFLRSMFFMAPSMESILPPYYVSIVLVVLSVLLLLQLCFRHRRLEEVAGWLPSWLRSLVVAFFFLAVLLAPGSHRAFIYFQF